MTMKEAMDYADRAKRYLDFMRRLERVSKNPIRYRHEEVDAAVKAGHAVRLNPWKNVKFGDGL